MLTLRRANLKVLLFRATVILLLVVAAVTILPSKTGAVQSIVFPVLGGGSFSDDFNAPRSHGPHHATDIIASRHTPLVAAVNGTVTFAPVPQPSYGYMVSIRGEDGYKYNYIHLNNDNDGTDDGAGGPMKAYAADIKPGNKVIQGQHIGWVGDSGNAEGSVPHLHFEIIDPSGNPVNPYDSLRQAPRLTQTKQYPQLAGEILPYGPGINATVQVAAGNLDSDTGNEYITAAGRGVGPHVRVFNENNSFSNYGFFAYNTNYRGGVNVAAGDIDNGADEIITGTGPGSTTHVRIFKPNGQAVGQFFAYPGYNTGVNVTACDVDADGVDEIITGTGAGSTSHVKIFEPNGQLISSFFAYPGYYVGADVGCGDINTGNPGVEIVTGAGPGGGAHVKAFSKNGQLLSNFFAYDNFYGGVRIDVGNVRTGSAAEEILTAPYSNGGPDIRVFSASGNLITSRGLYESWWSGNFDVAAGEGRSWVGTGGNRRSSVRPGP